MSKNNNGIHLSKLTDYTGKNIKIAVIDTGIERSHSIFKNKNIIAGGVVFDGVYNGEKSPIIESEYDGIDSNGHGTAIAGIIHSIAKDAKLYSVRILDSNKNGSIEGIIAGISWAIENKMDIINLSLGDTDLSNASRFYHLLEECFNQNIIIVAADNNFLKLSLPSQFSSVVSVADIETDNRYEIHHHQYDTIEFLARGKNIKVAWKNDSEEIKSGNSFAAPHITGIIALIKEYKKDDYCDCSFIKTTLQNISVRSSKYTNDAFISYVNDDAYWGKWLLEDIKKYRRKNSNVVNVSKNVNDFVKYETRNSYLEETTKKALLDSEYLIIICSKNIRPREDSKSCERIKEELKEFAKNRDNNNDEKNIIFIKLDAYPNEWLDEYKDISVTIDVYELGKSKNDIKAEIIEKIAPLIFDYTEAEFKAIKTKEGNRRKKIIALLSAVVIIVLVIFSYNYLRTTIKYYNTFVYQYGVQKGVGRLNRSNVLAKNISYKFEYRKGKVREVSRINSYGNFIDNENNISLWTNSYKDDKILSITCMNKYGIVVVIRNYSDNLNAIELVDTENHLHSIEKGVSITVYNVEYDTNGYVSEEIYFRDKSNNKTDDGIGCYGKRYDVSTNGIVINEYLLNQSSNMHAYVKYEHDKYGNETKMSKYNAYDKLIILEDNYAGVKDYYDDNGNWIEKTYFDINEDRTTDGAYVASEKVTYDKRGNVVSKSIYGIDGKRTGTFDMSSVTLYEYDKKGNRIFEAYFDETFKDSNRQESATEMGQGYIHAIKYKYDDALKITTTFYDKNTNVVGGYEEQRIFEGGSSLYTKKSLDIKGEIISSDETAPIVNTYYNDFNDIIEQQYLYKDNSYFSSNGISFIEYKYDNYKRNNKTTYYDKNATIIKMNVINYSDNGRVTSREYFGLNGNPTNKRMGTKNRHSISVHRVEWLYDDYGKITSERYFDSNNKPYMNKHGYHGITNIYNQNGEISFERYFDTNNNYALIDGISGYTHSYDENDRLKSTEYFGLNNKSIMHKTYGYSKVEYEYDNNNEINESRYFDANYKLLLIVPKQ